MLDNNGSEINLNLKVPPEQSDGNFSMKDLILTLYDSRKIFLICCFIGLLLGIAAAGVSFITQVTKEAAPVVSGDVSVRLTLNYAPVEWGIFPNGSGFNVNSFYSIKIWDNALKAVKSIKDNGNNSGNGNNGSNNNNSNNSADSKNIITAADVRSQVNIVKDDVKQNEYIFTIPFTNSKIFKSDDEKKVFLKALCEEYKKFIEDKYYTGESTGRLYGQRLGAWIDSCQEIIWDPFSFDTNFSMIKDRYQSLAVILDYLYSDDPAYKTQDGKTFYDYSKEFRDICIVDIGLWTAKLEHNVYIRNIDQFKEEYLHQIDTMKIKRDYNLDLVDSYNRLLASFQQKDAQGVKVQEAADILRAAQNSASTAADLAYKIKQMEYNQTMLAQTGEQTIISNSREAENALTSFIKDLENNQETLRKVIYDYYQKINKTDAENSIVYTSALVTVLPDQPVPETGVNITKLLMILIGLTFAGFLVGFCISFIKKYIPEKAEKLTV
jgi:hypothetical protein